MMVFRILDRVKKCRAVADSRKARLESITVKLGFTLALIAASSMFFCCTASVRDSKVPVPPVVEKKEGVTGPSGFDYSKLNFYIGASRINLLANSFSDIRGLLGDGKETGHHNKYQDSIGWDGLEVNFVTDSRLIHPSYQSELDSLRKGDIVSATITSALYKIEGGGAVGDSRSKISKLYPGGLVVTGTGENGLPKGVRIYSYQLTTKDGSDSLGFTFNFDKDDRVESIVLAITPLVP